MTELQRISNNLEACTKNIQTGGVQTPNLSLAIISQSLISIAEELAIMNDRMQEKEQKNKSLGSET